MRRIVGIVQKPFIQTPGPQGPQGASGSAGDAPADPTNATFVGAGQISPTSGATAQNGQACSCTFGSKLIEFTVLLDNEGESIRCQTSYNSPLIQVLSDPAGLALSSDGGTGIWIHKSSLSYVVSFKNRTGAANKITVKAFDSSISSATAWA